MQSISDIKIIGVELVAWRLLRQTLRMPASCSPIIRRFAGEEK